MMEYIYDEDLGLLNDNILDEKCKIVYMKRNVTNYFIHIVCCQFSSVEALTENWRELVNNVSEAIQKKLNEIIEIYNVYIVFFQPGVEEVLAYNIEQDKYSSRKLVILEEMPENKIKLEKIINSKLFDLKIEKDDKDKFEFMDNMDLINDETGLEKYIEKYAWEIMDEKN